ncbi:ABC transporter ATP-binding protein [Vallitalea maricola]|uniref:ATP-binding cassette domain-containing protein n=1 Tax=Vallitalea maricola TaxID=3074433 RepID=A0ACB5UFY1_9FIRM|nr:ATP-binding cassette domain-containing protein [Vallitalea sp. AN17-2]
MLAIEVENLTKQYGKHFKAVEKASFSVETGEILALLGPNGAGKTTLFKMMTSLSKITAGKVNIMGYDLHKDEYKVKSLIGYSCQEIGLDPESSVLFNMRLFGKYQHIYGDKLKKRVDFLLQLFELKEVENRKVKLLSGGMKKKLEIATSLIAEPKILFLDEPTLGLDIESRKKLWGYIQQLNEEQEMTIILTTHYLEEAEKLCDKLVILESGKIIKQGYINDLKEEVANDLIKINFSKYEEHEAIEYAYSKLTNLSFVNEVKKVKQELIVSVSNGRSYITDILDETKNWKYNIKSIMVTEASLEDIYLEHTGNYIREV